MVRSRLAIEFSRVAANSHPVMQGNFFNKTARNLKKAHSKALRGADVVERKIRTHGEERLLTRPERFTIRKFDKMEAAGSCRYAH